MEVETVKKIKVDLSRVDLFTVDPDQPVTCPECGARTEFEEVDISGCSNGENVNPVGFQRHLCLNANCECHETPFFTEFPAGEESAAPAGEKVDDYTVFHAYPAAKAAYQKAIDDDDTYCAHIAVVTETTDDVRGSYLVVVTRASK